MFQIKIGVNHCVSKMNKYDVPGNSLNLELLSSLSLRKRICVLPWFFEGFHVQLAHLYFAGFLIVKKGVCMLSKFTISPSSTAE